MQFVVVNNTSGDEISSNSSGHASSSDENSCRGGPRFGRGGRGCGRGGCGRGRGRRGCGRPSRNSSLDTVQYLWEQNEPSSFTYTYTQTPGPTASISNDPSACTLFCRFFTDEVWKLIVTETNRYAATIVGNTAHARPWYGVTVEEIKAFFGIVIMMGILKLPQLELYWSTKHPHISTPGTSSVMPLVRFEQIFRFLHLNNNTLVVMDMTASSR